MMTTREDTINAYREYQKAKADTEINNSELGKKMDAIAPSMHQWNQFGGLSTGSMAITGIGAPSLGVLFMDPAWLALWTVTAVAGYVACVSFKKLEEKDAISNVFRLNNENVISLKRKILDTAANEARSLGFNVLEIHHQNYHIVTTEGVITVAFDKENDIPELLLGNQVIKRSYRDSIKVMTNLNGSPVAVNENPLMLSS